MIAFMSKPLTDVQRVFLLLVWLVAFGAVIVLGLDARGRGNAGALVEVWRLFMPLVTAGLVTLIVHWSNRLR
jgi:hypothetical protein